MAGYGPEVMLLSLSPASTIKNNNKKFPIRNFPVRNSNSTRSRPKHYYRPTTCTFSRRQHVHLSLHRDDNGCVYDGN